MAARLARGERTYRGRSLRRPPAALVGEVAEELLDMCGWAFLLWLRLEGLGRAVGQGSRHPRRGGA